MLGYVLPVSFCVITLVIAAVISNLIQYETGTKPRDAQKRKLWFWLLAFIGPAAGLFITWSVFMPEKAMEKDAFESAVPIGTGIGFVLYILLGFLLSRMFRNGKLGNWF
jgi:sulfoxide reductase heme-binding subunit YedZ